MSILCTKWDIASWYLDWLKLENNDYLLEASIDKSVSFSISSSSLINIRPKERHKDNPPTHTYTRTYQHHFSMHFYLFFNFIACSDIWVACRLASGSPKARYTKYQKTSKWNPLHKISKKHHIYKKEPFKNINKAYKTFGIYLIFTIIKIIKNKNKNTTL